MKSQLDERQIQDAARIAGISFYVCIWYAQFPSFFNLLLQVI